MTTKNSTVTESSIRTLEDLHLQADRAKLVAVPALEDLQGEGLANGITSPERQVYVIAELRKAVSRCQELVAALEREREDCAEMPGRVIRGVHAAAVNLTDLLWAIFWKHDDKATRRSVKRIARRVNCMPVLMNGKREVVHRDEVENFLDRARLGKSATPLRHSTLTRFMMAACSCGVDVTTVAEVSVLREKWRPPRGWRGDRDPLPKNAFQVQKLERERHFRIDPRGRTAEQLADTFMELLSTLPEAEQQRAIGNVKAVFGDKNRMRSSQARQKVLQVAKVITREVAKHPWGRKPPAATTSALQSPRAAGRKKGTPRAPDAARD